jgi:hypothetical protein
LFSFLFVRSHWIGLKEDEALDILAINHTSISPSLFSRLICQIDSFVSDASGYYVFFHDFMRVAVNSRYFGAECVNEMEVESDGEGFELKLKREELYRYFMSGNEAIPLERVIDEVPFQLFECMTV